MGKIQILGVRKLVLKMLYLKKIKGDFFFLSTPNGLVAHTYSLCRYRLVLSSKPDARGMSQSQVKHASCRDLQFPAIFLLVLTRPSYLFLLKAFFLAKSNQILIIHLNCSCWILLNTCSF